MRVVIATAGLHARGGLHSYLDAVLCEMVALDHEVHVVAPAFGRPEAIWEAGGFTHPRFDEVPGPVDGVIAFLDFSGIEARVAFPGVPLLALSHGPWYAQDAPSADADPCAAVALSDLSLQRLEQSLIAERGVPIVRLTQPAELRVPAAPASNVLPEVPRQAVVVAHRLTTRREPLLDALRGRGIAVSVFGGDDQDDEVLGQVLAADIVIGIGRVILEGMAAGRACLILDEIGGGGWLTPESYAEYEASGFLFGPGTGVAPEDLGSLIDAYRPDLGRAGRELALRHHAPGTHAARLLQLLRCAPPPRVTADPGRLLSEAASLRRRYERRAARTIEGWDNAARDREARVLLDQLRSEHEELRAACERAERERDQARAQLERLHRSRSWRMTDPLRRAAEIRRGRR